MAIKYYQRIFIYTWASGRKALVLCFYAIASPSTWWKIWCQENMFRRVGNRTWIHTWHRLKWWGSYWCFNVGAHGSRLIYHLLAAELIYLMLLIFWCGVKKKTKFENVRNYPNWINRRKTEVGLTLDIIEKIHNRERRKKKKKKE